MREKDTLEAGTRIACLDSLAGTSRSMAVPIGTEERRMEMTNEVTLNGDVYCFEELERVTEARAWIDAGGSDIAQFRNVFPDARPVSTHPYGSGSQRGD